MRTVSLTLPASSNSPVEISTGFGCGYIRLQYSLVSVTITDPDTGMSFPLEPGDDATIEPVKRIRISHTSGQEQAIRLLIGNNGEKAGSAKVAQLPTSATYLSNKIIVPYPAGITFTPSQYATSVMIQNKDAVYDMVIGFSAVSDDDNLLIGPRDVITFGNPLPLNAIRIKTLNPAGSIATSVLG